MHVSGKPFGNVCLKQWEIPYFLICVGTRGIKQKKVQTFGLAGRPNPQSLPLVGHPDLFLRKTLRRVLSLLTAVKNLKRVSERIIFQSIKFIVCKVKDQKIVAESLVAFSLLKIIHPFQGKKHLRPTYWNLNCNPQEYWIGY